MLRSCRLHSQCSAARSEDERKALVDVQEPIRGLDAPLFTLNEKPLRPSKTARAAELTSSRDLRNLAKGVVPEARPSVTSCVLTAVQRHYDTSVAV